MSTQIDAEVAYFVGVRYSDYLPIGSEGLNIGFQSRIDLWNEETL